MTKKIIYASLTGTTAMTLFSYVVSEAKGENFKEPELLARVLKEAGIDLDHREAMIAGIAGHYLAGLLFVWLFSCFWDNLSNEPGLIAGIGFGAASGLCGIAAWELSMKMCDREPVKDKNRFFSHLFLAHIVFGIFAAMTYRKTGK